MSTDHAPSPGGLRKTGGEEARNTVAQRKARRQEEAGRPSRREVSQCLHIWATFYRLDSISEPRDLCLSSGPWRLLNELDKR